MKNLLLGAAVGVLSTTGVFGAERYELEVIARTGELLGDNVLLDLDTDDAPPVINNFGEIGFFAVTANIGEGLYYRSADGDVKRLFGLGDSIRRPETNERLIFFGADEEAMSLAISDTGHIYHSDREDIDYVGVDDHLLHSFPDEHLRYLVPHPINPEASGFAFNHATFDRFGGVYMNGRIGLDEAGFPNEWATIKDNGRRIDDEQIVLRSGIFDGHEIGVVNAVVSPTGRIGFNGVNPVIGPHGGTTNGIFFENRLVFTPEDFSTPDKPIETVLLGDGGINDSGQILVLAGRVFEHSELRLDGEVHLTSYQQIADYEIGTVDTKTHLTADGSVLLVTGVCQPNCLELVPEASHVALLLNDEIIFKTGDEIADEAALVGFSRWSANDRGDVVFMGRFDDGIKRLVVARRSIEPVFGDVNNDNAFDLADVYNISLAIQDSDNFQPQFDLVEDGVIDQSDLAFWIHEIKGTYFGDADLNGEFNSSDIVRIFTTGEYEDGIALNSSWLDGDFDGDGDFSTSDLVVAFQDSGYEAGPRHATHAVPETGDQSILILTLIFYMFRTRLRFNRR